MFSFKKILAVSISALILGCSSTEMQSTVSAENSLQLLNKAEVCCSSFGQLQYAVIEQPGLYDFALTGKSQALDLSTGKSFVQGVQLPSNSLEGIRVKVTSSIEESVYVPNVMLLDKFFNPLISYGSEDIDYDSRSIFNGERFEREIKVSDSQLSSGQVKYLLVYTTKRDMDEVTILPQLDQGTIRVGRQDEPRMFGDVIVPHSALGNFRIRFSYVQHTDVKLASESAPTIQGMENKEVVVPVLEQVVDKEEMTAVSDSIQPETEAMYIELVKKAVQENKLEKALKFVEEGEKAGSSKLRDVFFDALKKHQ